jgi:hypothetical protein
MVAKRKISFLVRNRTLIHPVVSYFTYWHNIVYTLKGMLCHELFLFFQDIDNLEDSLFASSFNKKQEKTSSTKTAVKSALKVSVSYSCPCY